MYDLHEANTSRRYKALGSFWNYSPCGRRPKNPTHGTKWPPCHCLGVAYSADGLHWDHAEEESKHDPGNQPGLDVVGQVRQDRALPALILNLRACIKIFRRTVSRFQSEHLMLTFMQDDGALDLAIWDSHLGSYWGLVRLDAAEPKNHRRTGRFVTKDFSKFSAGEQVFEGTDDYQVG